MRYLESCDQRRLDVDQGVLMGLLPRDDGWRLPGWLWKRIEVLLPERPAHPSACHNLRAPDRQAMKTILLVLRTEMQWDALNICGVRSPSSARRQCQERQAGVFHEIGRHGLLDLEETVGLDWSFFACDM